jgi:site-specific DNA-methyltransferase (adenine-specific)
MLDFGYYNMDCMQGMKEFPDKYFDLAIVDPPYGAGFTEGGGCGGWFEKYKPTTNEGGVLESIRAEVRPIQKSRHSTNGMRKGQKPPEWWNLWGGNNKKIITWDVAPKQEYFNELFRVSRNQIIWGGNYFPLPPTRCFLIWRKINVPQDFSMAMCEYAWTSFNNNAKCFEKSAVGQQGRFHPTQKPVDLYKWILSNYAQAGDKILDTHVGSASSLIACEDMGYSYVGFEIDQEYYDKGVDRIKRHKAQVSIMDFMDDWRLP